MHANNRDMEFTEWLYYLLKIATAVYQIDPSEINFTFGNEGQAALFGRLGRVFIVGFVRGFGLETANLRNTVKIESSGTEVRFRGVIMSADELVGLVTRLTGQER